PLFTSSSAKTVLDNLLHEQGASFDTRAGFPVTLLRMRLECRWHQRNYLILSAREASSRRTHDGDPANPVIQGTERLTSGSRLSHGSSRWAKGPRDDGLGCLRALFSGHFYGGPGIRRAGRQFEQAG